ncbi:MAG: DNA-packaging protein [Hyphomonadaceae bacterium]
MKKDYARSYAEDLNASLSATAREVLPGSLPLRWVEFFLRDFHGWARGEQLPPPGDWRAWLFMGGRGSGKTRAGAEWVSELARTGRARRIALIGPTFHDVREVMVEGPSGVRALPHVRPAYEASRKRLIWPNGAQAFCFSAEDPESLRGPQFDAAWADEVCFWAYPDETLATLQHGLRLGERPRLLLTTTPRPIRALMQLVAAPDTVITRSGSWANRANLADDFVVALAQRWTGTARERQEIDGELIEDVEGALWKRADLETLRTREHGEFDRIIVAVDPPAAIGAKADACGIIAAAGWGEGWRRCAMVLADASLQGAAPSAWAEQAATLARSIGAHAIVAEANNGGEMVRAVLRAAAPDIHVRLVHASEGKRARAEPIAAYYAQRRVVHAAAFAALEDEMCAFGVDDFKSSPDRVDALVWALTDLLMGGAQPRLRVL